jgi:iron complex outermembrane receptor protein
VKIAPRGTLYDQSRAVASKFGSKIGLTTAGLLDGRMKLTAGFDTLSDKGKQDMYLTGRTFVPESKYTNLSLFLQGEYKVFDTLTLHAGVRRENADLKVDSYRTLAAYNNTHVEGGKIKFNETLANAGLVLTPAIPKASVCRTSAAPCVPSTRRDRRSAICAIWSRS